MKNLFESLIAAKNAEKAATAARIEAENALLKLYPAPDEGTRTVKADQFQLVIRQEIKRTLDEKRWDMIRDNIPEQLRPVRYVEIPKIENAGLKWLQENEPGFYKLVCTAITEKPAKPSLTITINKGE